LMPFDDRTAVPLALSLLVLLLMVHECKVCMPLTKHNIPIYL
jgi:hypothetical protein